MTNHNQLIANHLDRITEIAIALLKEHAEYPEDTIYHAAINKKTIDYMGDFKSPLITESTAEILLRGWIAESLLHHGKVLIYTCKDNAEIAIEDIDEDNLSTDYMEGLFTDHDYFQYPELRGILYIGYD